MKNTFEQLTKEKLTKLSDYATYDISCSSCATTVGRQRDPLDPMHKWIYPAALPSGETVPILKILMTNVCINKCKYCIVCAHRNLDAVNFEPDELAKIFMAMYYRRLVKGIFISSAIGIDANMTMDNILKTAEILRLTCKFTGYMHLKILPGVSFAHIERAAQLADRVSINLESPNQERLSKIAQAKDFSGLMERIKWINQVLEHQSPENSYFWGPKTNRKKSHTTQFVVGAADESDKELIKTTSELYQKYNLHRAYFSAFQPVAGTPLENHAPVPLVREHRLYQTDFLFRKYNFSMDDIIFDNNGNLSLDKDPKAMWAAAHPEIFPMEINKADLHQLLRVPGIGPTSAKRLVSLRRKGRFSTLAELKETGMLVAKARNFLLINGKFMPKPVQLELSL